MTLRYLLQDNTAQFTAGDKSSNNYTIKTRVRVLTGIRTAFVMKPDTSKQVSLSVLPAENCLETQWI